VGSGIVKAGIPEVQYIPANFNSGCGFVMGRIQIEALVETIDSFSPVMRFLLQQALQEPESRHCIPFNSSKSLEYISFSALIRTFWIFVISVDLCRGL
jgi:hypothetical protein